MFRLQSNKSRTDRCEKQTDTKTKTTESEDNENTRKLTAPEGQTKGQSSDCIIFEPVRKINIYAKNHKKIATLAHTLKRLSHEGRMDKFNAIVGAINDKYVIKKLQAGKYVRSSMEIADIKFTALDAQIEARRLKYDTSLTDSEVFAKMEYIIKFTSDPTVSSMTYLARFGSALSMKNTIDNGLVYLQYAREHSEHVLPCKDTGMVYYIEINLLSQKYEHTPSKDLKQEVLKTIERAIAQFCNEPDDIRKDYERMLMLKMAFCHLGLSLFGKRMKDVIVTDEDRKSAKNCIDFIEKPGIWERMERRRKMLYHIAKAEYYRQEGVSDLSLLNAKEAERFAKENKWTAELPNILSLIDDIDTSLSSAVKDEDTANDVLNALLEDTDDDVEEEQIIETL